MILVTGTTGFIGDYLLQSLIEKFGKNQVVAFTSRATDKCQYLLHNNYNFENDYFVNNGLEQIATIIHAGAFTPKSASESNNFTLCTSNIINTNKIISADFPNLQKFIFLSTLDVYGYDNPITELSPTNPISLYGFSKLYCEEMLKAWSEKTKIANCILRVGHVYGPGEEKYEKLLPNVMKLIIKGEPIELHGKGDDIRTFIHIRDVIQAIISSIGLDTKHEVINLVGNEQITIRDLIYKIIEISGKNVPVNIVKSDKKPRYLVFDNSKLKKLIYTPNILLIDGLKAEWDYFNKK